MEKHKKRHSTGLLKERILSGSFIIMFAFGLFWMQNNANIVLVKRVITREL